MEIQVKRGQMITAQILMPVINKSKLKKSIRIIERLFFFIFLCIYIFKKTFLLELKRHHNINKIYCPAVICKQGSVLEPNNNSFTKSIISNGVRKMN